MTSLRRILESTGAELPPAPLAWWAAVFFSFSVLTFLISLALAQIFLAFAAVTYAAQILRYKVVPNFPPVKLPLTLFCLFSILSIFWAENPAAGWFVVRKLVLFLILLLTVNLVTNVRHLKRLYQALFIESAIVGVVAVVQFVNHYRVVRGLHAGQVYAEMTNARAHGLMGHWMNFGGQQMLVFVALSAFLLLAHDWAPGEQLLHERMLWWLVWAVIATSIILNFTRGVWLGCFIAAVYLVARWRPRWLWLLPVLLIGGYFATPGLIRKRLESVRHPSTDPSLAIRFEMWQVGWRMMQSHPLVGVGPNNISETYTLYLPPGKAPIVGYREHLHNDVVQLGAERGLPCLISWIWLMMAFSWHALRIRRRLIREPSRVQHVWMVDAAFACLLAFVAEGCFEFNFGTSPVLMVFLYIASTPFVMEMQELKKESGVRRQESEDRGQESGVKDRRQKSD